MTTGTEEAAEGRVYTLSGGDWDEIVSDLGEAGEDHVVVNMGPQHPSTHGVLRLILELDGETVTEARCCIGYLALSRKLQYRNYTQGVCCNAPTISPIFNEAAYCLAVERLLGIEEQVPDRANVIRVMLMELNRISSHLVALATGGLELGALTVMTAGFRERELVLDVLEMITGLRMNHGFIRPGGLAQDLPPGAVDKVRDVIRLLAKRFLDYENLLNENPIWLARTKGVGYLGLTGCIALGITGPILRATGLPHDLRKSQPYCGYESYEFDTITRTGADAYDRYLIRVTEMKESLKIVEQCLDRLEPGPVMVEDKKIAWPAQLALGSDGLGNSLEHIRKIMATSMEALIHHFKLVTEGFAVPAGQVYTAVESPRGELGCHMVSDGGTRPYRVHLRDPPLRTCRQCPRCARRPGGADVIAAVASLDRFLVVDR
jgi:NADH-quinone oxidoreductase subunit D